MCGTERCVSQSERPMQGKDQPSREDVLQHPRLHVVENRLSLALQATLRDRRTSDTIFHATAIELSRLLLWEALQDVALDEETGERFDGAAMPVQQLAERITGVVVLRAGLAFEPAFRALLPNAPLHQVGLWRDEETLEPQFYASNLPIEAGWADRVLIMDPMLATGGSATATIELVRRSHDGRIDVLCLVAAPFGVQRVIEAGADARIVTLALDDRLNDAGFILPGLGDAGDRYFGT